MTDTGPTTAGSIVGKLRMDRDQWIRDVAATKQDVREIEGLDPDIHIDDNAASVITRLRAVKAATESVAASEEDLGRKTRKTTEETIRANEANRTSVTRIGAVVTAVALLAPLLTPVAAGAIGVGGAFLGMGAAGVLALVGIHREMEDGTGVGRAYREGVDDLGGSLNMLSRTAAVAMLSAFRRVVAETRDALPGLNTQVAQFSSLLGRSGADVFTGAINSLRVLNPLFLTAGLYLASLAEGFRRWTEGSGIEEFSSYALGALPQVVDVLGKLATMVLHVLQALAPLGTIGIAVLSGVADLISNIPVEVLSQLIVTLTWGAVAFKAWGFVAPMLASIATQMGAVSAATTIATGPIGWVIAGLSALAGIFAVTIAANQGATAAMQDYTAAVQADTGAIGENVRAKAAQDLQTSGALDAARRLKISLADVTAATLGEADAQKRVSAQLDALNEKLGTYAERKSTIGDADQKQHDDIVLLTNAMQSNSATIQDSVSDYQELQAALEVTTDATKAQQWADEAAAGALGISVETLQAARAGQDGVASATAKATAEMYLQGDAAGLLKQAIDALNGKALSAAEAQNQFEAQLVRMPDYVNEATGEIDSAGAALDGMSESAITNRGALLDLIQSAQNSAQAYRDQGASSDEAKQKLIDAKKAIEDQAVANGMNRDAVKAYLDELFKIPEEIPKTKVEVDTATAEAQIAAFMANVNSRVATIKVRATMPDLNGSVSGSGRPGVAAGGTIRGLAAGGGGTVSGPGTAGSDTAGLFRLANGEEVISNIFGQADRNRGLLKAINAGYTPSQATAGTVHGTTSTVTSAQQREAPTVIIHNHITTTQNEDPAVLAQIVGAETKRSIAGVKL